jgi:N-acetylneuraminic acid mutarotase
MIDKLLTKSKPRFARARPLRDRLIRAPGWTACAPLPAPRRSCAAADSGARIYVFGGEYVHEVVDGYIFTRPHVDVLAYNSAANSWTVAGQMPTPRSACHAVASPDGRIHVIGGRERLPNQWIQSRVFETCDPGTGVWTANGNVPTLADKYAAAGTASGQLYLIGGHVRVGPGSDDWEFSGVVSRYDPQTNGWNFPGTIPQMPTPRSALAAIQGADGRIYAIGGLANGNRVADTEAYDPVANSWTVLAPMPTARSDLTLVAGKDGRIYALGGMDCHGQTVGTVEIYDPTSGGWTTAEPFPLPRMFHASALSADRRIHVIGGHSKADCYADPEILTSVVASVALIP